MAQNTRRITPNNRRDHHAASLVDEEEETERNYDVDAVRNYYHDYVLPVKRKRVYKERLVLSDETEQDLCDWYRSEPIFYDKSLKIYRDSNLKNKMLSEKGASLDPPLSLVEISRFFASMRTQVGKLVKAGPGDSGSDSGSAAKTLTEREQWVVENFGFLTDHIRRISGRARRTANKPASWGSQSPAVPDVHTDEYDDEEEFELESSTFCPSSTQQSRSGKGGPFKRPASPPATRTDTDLQDYVLSTTELADTAFRQVPSDRSEVFHPMVPFGRRTFCDMLCTEGAILDDQLWQQWQVQAFQHLMKLKERRIQQLQQQTQLPNSFVNK